MRLLSLTLSAALGLSACLSGSNPDDPYAGMSCDQKIAAIAREIRDWHDSRSPAAKPAASDTAQPDTAKTDTARTAIPVLRGYPPVAGLVPGASGYQVAVQDSSRGGYSGPSTGPQWIAPAGFDPVTATIRPLPAAPDPATETTALSAFPASVSTLQIISSGAYKARVRILDRDDVLVRQFDQDFGYQGELANPNRKANTGLVSYLVWDGKDATGAAAPTGVYLWEVWLKLESGQVIGKTEKTGFIGEECRPAR